MREIVPNILTWSWFSEPQGYNFNGHLVRHPEGNLCIDPVEPGGKVLDEIARTGVARILLSNRNHSRAVNRVRLRTGARAAIHPADAAHARSQGSELDDEISVGERIGPFRVVSAAGKSPGEVAFHWPERGILVVGDAVIGRPAGRCGLLPDHVVDDPPCLRESVRSFLELDFDILLVGDGEPILKDAMARLRELVETFPV